MLLGLVPLLWLWLRWGDGRARNRLAALLGPRAGEHVEHLPPAARQWRRFFVLMGLTCLIVALARPQWGANEIVVQQRGTDVVIALDISNSMRAEDVVPNRLARARAELGTLLEGFDRGRVGLVLFAGQAFVQCPLTLDLGTAQLFLRMADPDMISAQGTAIGAALTVSANLLDSGADEGVAASRRAILLVTDGEDLEGGWEEAATHCSERGIAIVPIGVGEETGGLIPLPGDDSAATGYMKDDTGKVVMSRLDLVSLQQLSDYGGGSLFRIGARGLDIEGVRALIAGLGERDLAGRHVSQYQDRFVWPLALAFACLWAWTLVRARRFARPVAQTVAVGMMLIAILAPASARANILQPAGAAAATRGLEYYQAGDYESALDAFQEARALAPDDPRLALAVGAVMSRLERHEDAAREFSRVLALSDDPELRAEALYNAGTDALTAGDPARAVEQLRRSLSLEPDRSDTLRNLEYAVRMMEQQPPQDSQPSEDGEEGDQQQQQDGEQGDQQQDQDQEQSGDEQQDQQQQQDGQDETEQQEQQDQSESQDQQEDQQPEESESQAGEEPQPTEEELSRERALSILKALDRDEEELRKSLQKRLKGQPTTSGKRW
jgi:Ca-activated chloride channel homolog